MTTEIQTSDSEVLPVYVYNADGSSGGLKAKFAEIYQNRYLLRNLTVRNLKARYKNSALGILWSMLNPLGLMVVFTILFTVLSAESSPRQYPVFILVALIPWTFFRGSVTSGMVSITNNGALLRKVYFPRELLPTSSLLSNLVNFFFALIVLVIFLYFFGLGLTIHALWVPAILMLQLIFSLGLIFALSSLTVFYKDVLMIMEVVLTAWFFLTPIFYSFDFFGETATVMGITFNPAQLMRWLNPMASIIDGYRTVLWGTSTSTGPVAMNPAYMFRTFVTVSIVLVIGYWIFARVQHLFGEKV